MQIIDLQIAPGAVNPVINMSQNDIGRQFQLRLFDGTSAYSIPSGTSLSIDGIKPDRKGYSYDDNITYSDNVITITTKLQMTCVMGVVHCKVRMKKSGADIGTLCFNMVVEPTPINENTDVSETELPAVIATAKREAQMATEAADSARSSATAAQNSATNAAASASTSNTNALKSEGYAIGTQNGTPVTGGTYFENNSKYYSEQSAGSAAASSNSAVAALSSEQNAKLSERILDYYVDFVIPRFEIINNRIYVSDPAEAEFMAANNRLYIKHQS